MQYLNLPEQWQTHDEYLANRQLKQHKTSLAGLDFMGYIDVREAYRLKQPITWTEKKLNGLQIIALDYNGHVELAMYPNVKVNGRREPLIEIIDWLEFSFVLIPINFSAKEKLLTELLETLELD